jgi:hypothetical protein
MAIDLTELEWAVNDVTLPNAAGPNKIEPTAGLKTTGVDWEQLLNAEELNWMFNKLYLAIADLDSRTVVAGQLPVGSVYQNWSDNRNPGVILGYGTWVAVSGVVLIGAGSYTDVTGQTRTFTAGDVGGEYDVALTVNQIPPHTHQYSSPTGGGGPNDVSGSNRNDGAQTGSTGGGQAHENMPPYHVVYAWRRTA